ncbi:hypothetical protein [Tenacibaculum agarivorans]|uniref:hypothetical protein n=1 Tax=Tenacibaculum agarivorans TaxID=1908389 RepID=UPI00094BBB6E|nr:hypothetical protein [Tenacibaculum agarivorans]
MFSNQIPLFISILFLIAFCFPILLIANLFKDTSQSNTRNRTILFYTIYLALVTIASYYGLFDTISLPPKIIQLTTFPLLLFYLIIISNTTFYKKALKKIALSKLIQIHIFRLIGSTFIILYGYSLLPKSIALIAGIGDITTAISSLFVAKAVINQKSYAKNLALIWNTFGMLDILVTSTLAILLTKKSIDTGSLGVEFLAEFPFCFIPAFAPATILFLHISTFKKILNPKYA